MSALLIERLSIAAGGFLAGMALIMADFFFEGPCPDRFAELAAKGPIPEPAVLILLGLGAAALTGCCIFRSVRSESERP